MFNLNFHSTKKKSRKENFEVSQEKPILSRELKLFLKPFNVIIISLIVIGLIAFIQVGTIVWKDITVWGKDINLIFFGSRTGENISLGIGLQIIHYYVIGIILIFLAIVLVLVRRWNNKKM